MAREIQTLRPTMVLRAPLITPLLAVPQHASPHVVYVAYLSNLYVYMIQSDVVDLQ